MLRHPLVASSMQGATEQVAVRVLDAMERWGRFQEDYDVGKPLLNDALRMKIRVVGEVRARVESARQKFREQWVKIEAEMENATATLTGALESAGDIGAKEEVRRFLAKYTYTVFNMAPGRLTIMGNRYGDEYNTEWAQVVGHKPIGVANEVNFTKFAAERKLDFEELAEELMTLGTALRKEPDTAERDSAIGALADAEREARKQDQAGVARSLSRLQSRVLEVGEKVGVGLAVQAIKAAMGF